MSRASTWLDYCDMMGDEVWFSTDAIAPLLELTSSLRLSSPFQAWRYGMLPLQLPLQFNILSSGSGSTYVKLLDTLLILGSSCLWHICDAFPWHIPHSFRCIFLTPFHCTFLAPFLSTILAFFLGTFLAPFHGTFLASSLSTFLALFLAHSWLHFFAHS